MKSRHCTHWFVDSLQTGVSPEQLASLVHPAVHVWVVRLHTPLAPVHCELSVHCTQLLVPTSQTGVPGTHALVLAPLHSTQRPATHAGAAWLVQAALAAVPKSPLHGTQALVVVLQTGVFPVHAALSAPVHWTQVFDVVLHTAVAPVHCALFDAVH